MKPIRGLLLAVVVLLGMAATPRPAAACSIAGDTLHGNFWYVWSDPGRDTVTCGNATTPCVTLQVNNKACNDLQSYGTISGQIKWFGDGGTYRSITAVGTGIWGYQRTLWLWPNESAVFNWHDQTVGVWYRLSCHAVSGSSDWSCVQLTLNGQTWSPGSTGGPFVTLHRVF